jgi:hypothetical protein
MLLLVFLCVCLGTDFGILGLKDPNSWKLLRILSSSKKHRIACFDERPELTQNVVSQGGISAFGKTNVLSFASIVVVFEDDVLDFIDRLDMAEIKGKEFVFFNRAADEGGLIREALEKKGASGVMAEFRGCLFFFLYFFFVV